jgi:D-alanine-D-alanine ligase
MLVNDEKKLLLKKKIGILCGGWSSERKISLGTGACVAASLAKQGFDVKEIDVDRNLIKKLKDIDIAFIALHGKFGEDGTVQGILEFLDIPYTGSGVVGSAVGMDKIVSKTVFIGASIPTPEYYHEKDANLDEVVDRLGLPVVIKPCAEGSSVGVVIARTKKQLTSHYAKLSAQFPDLFFEKFIKGMMATCGILNDVPLPILEIAPKERAFYDYKSKYTKGMTDYIVPARIPEEQYKKTQAYALAAHKAIGARGFSRVDFMIDQAQNPYVLEVNTIPGLLPESNLPLEARAIGLTYDELIFEILKTALPRIQQ